MRLILAANKERIAQIIIGALIASSLFGCSDKLVQTSVNPEQKISQSKKAPYSKNKTVQSKKKLINKPKSCIITPVIKPKKVIYSKVSAPVVFSSAKQGVYYIYDATTGHPGKPIKAVSFLPMSDYYGRYRFGYVLKERSIEVREVVNGVDKISAKGFLSKRLTTTPVMGAYHDNVANEHYVAFTSDNSTTLEIWKSKSGIFKPIRKFSVLGGSVRTPPTVLPGGVSVFLDSSGFINVVDPNTGGVNRAYRVSDNLSYYSQLTRLPLVSFSKWHMVLIPAVKNDRLCFTVINYSDKLGINELEIRRLVMPKDFGNTNKWPQVLQSDEKFCEVLFPSYNDTHLNLVIFSLNSGIDGPPNWVSDETWQTQIRTPGEKKEQYTFYSYYFSPGSIRPESMDRYVLVAGRKLTVVQFLRDSFNKPVVRTVISQPLDGQAFGRPQVFNNGKDIYLQTNNSIKKYSCEWGNEEVFGLEMIHTMVSVTGREMASHLKIEGIGAICDNKLWMKRNDGRNVEMDINFATKMYDLTIGTSKQQIICQENGLMLLTDNNGITLKVQKNSVDFGVIPSENGKHYLPIAAVHPHGEKVLLADNKGGIYLWALSPKIKCIWKMNNQKILNKRMGVMALNKNQAYWITEHNNMKIVTDTNPQNTSSSNKNDDLKVNEIHLHYRITKIMNIGSDQLLLLSRLGRTYLARRKGYTLEFLVDKNRRKPKIIHEKVKDLIALQGSKDETHRLMILKKDGNLSSAQDPKCRVHLGKKRIQSVVSDTCGNLWILDESGIIYGKKRQRCW